MLVKRLWQAILEVLFPTCCMACEDKLLQEEQIICSSCLASIARTEHAILPDNGIDILFADHIKKLSQRQFKRK